MGIHVLIAGWSTVALRFEPGRTPPARFSDVDSRSMWRRKWRRVVTLATGVKIGPVDLSDSSPPPYTRCRGKRFSRNLRQLALADFDAMLVCGVLPGERTNMTDTVTRRRQLNTAAAAAMILISLVNTFRHRRSPRPTRVSMYRPMCVCVCPGESQTVPD